ncbi:MAG: FAD-dependent oxidoreductase [Candidatus Omnitrophica bacterium]|nr:FAD-dependent oxidoreductase [Candidatus Omnitrophota bacterium]
MLRERELIIVGGGPAGMAAAIAAHESGVRDILVLERDYCLGGILNQCIHTGFGIRHFKEVLAGPEYADRYVNQIQSIPEIEISIKSFVVKLTREKVLTYLKPGQMHEVKAKAIIMATGCRERTREMIHIAGTRPSGIFSAGLAQRLMNIDALLPGKEVLVVGSGDIGLIMARRFTLEGAKVKGVVEIAKTTRGLVRNRVQCIEDFNIPIYFSHKISKIYGRNRVEAVDVVQVDDTYKEIQGTLFKVPCDTILISVGLIPENELMEMAGVKLDKKTNSPVSDGLNKTSIPGIFSCGNSFKVYDIVDSVTRDSILAGHLAAEYLKGAK